MDKHQLRDLIRETLKEVDLFSDDAVELLMLTAAVETDLGYYIKQINGPGLGIFQTEPATHDDIVIRWLEVNTQRRRNFRDKIHDKMNNFVVYFSHHELVYNLKYAIVIARLKYYMDPAPIPSDSLGMARYWKRIYNTEVGKGNVWDALGKYQRLAMPIAEVG